MQVVLLSKIKMDQKLEMYPRGMFFIDYTMKGSVI